MANCEHAASVTYLVPREEEKEGAVCADCIAMGGQWVHLRKCLHCGQVGCCDSSPNRHARKHAAAHSHPVICSMEPKEIWSYCFEDEVALKIPRDRGR
ncbi:UBP-type zinc finger domain-containing protein [Parvularcula lutaonensis]|uniref:UBP-type zinc finger domain-containing protein n=1 Tax=Parvularcula lutaonensis TaxID=491923 RepID=A0ABV7MCI8_9PROT|nr:UBP-type zinc finger domain-containing protein [Parvularcula lutaonensis]GGY37208.1 hypothetical protein GCM10007148_01770 [Parvularcula lutaonensis]